MHGLTHLVIQMVYMLVSIEELKTLGEIPGLSAMVFHLIKKRCLFAQTQQVMPVQKSYALFLYG